MRNVFILAVVAGIAGSASAQVLVYDENSNNSYAQAGAASAGLGAVTVAGAANFNSLLTSGTWQAVAIDCPSSFPSDNWAALATYVSGSGGRVVMSFWDWDGSAFGTVRSAFGATSVQTFSTVGRTLSDAGTAFGAQIFAGVAGMPHSTWSDAWGDDGDAFAMAAGGEAGGIMSGFTNPAIFRGNGGRTVASFVIDEWAGDGAPKLWENMIKSVVPAPSTGLAFVLAGFAAGRRRR
ncbi:MAG: hypothetical protein IT436_14905 [Phycisphaerales bacterium]|nr:hypothetical protein [Phycisphaerales bacterium]